MELLLLLLKIKKKKKIVIIIKNINKQKCYINNFIKLLVCKKINNKFHFISKSFYFMDIK